MSGLECLNAKVLLLVAFWREELVHHVFLQRSFAPYPMKYSFVLMTISMADQQGQKPAAGVTRSLDGILPLYLFMNC